MKPLLKKPMYLFVPANIVLVFICAVLCGFILFLFTVGKSENFAAETDDNFELAQLVAEEIAEEHEKKEYIKWIDFNVPLQVMEQALAYDVASYNEKIHIDWVELIAYSAAKNWGKFSKNKKSKDIDIVAEKIKKGEKMSDLTQNMKLYDYYIESYRAVLGGFVGKYEVEGKNPDNPEETLYTEKYGLKVFSPVAKGFSYSHYRDFGVSRTYGYQRKHQGNDIMGNVGTPIIAIEDGYIEAMGWNQYGGWYC